MKKGKVKNVKYIEEWESHYGTLHKSKIEFENGDVGFYNSKTNPQTKFVVGQVSDYTNKDGRIKPPYNENQNSTPQKQNSTPKNQNSTPQKQNSTPQNQNSTPQKQNPTLQKNEKTQEYIIKQNALTNACNIVGESDVHKIIEIAEIFSNWVLTGEKPQQKKNDLPF